MAVVDTSFGRGIGTSLGEANPFFLEGRQFAWDPTTKVSRDVVLEREFSRRFMEDATAPKVDLSSLEERILLIKKEVDAVRKLERSLRLRESASDSDVADASVDFSYLYYFSRFLFTLNAGLFFFFVWNFYKFIYLDLFYAIIYLLLSMFIFPGVLYAISIIRNEKK